MQWILSMLYFVCPEHYVFDKTFGLVPVAKPQVIDKEPIDDKFNIYRNAFVGLPPPKTKKRAYVANQLFKERKPTKTERMQAEM